MKIMVADDDRDMVDVLSYWLKGHGYDVVRAFDGEYESASVAEIQGEWADFEYGGVCEGIRVQEGGCDGEGECLQDLVRVAAESVNAPSSALRASPAMRAAASALPA